MPTKTQSPKKKRLSRLAKNVRLWRLHRGLTQRDLAYEAETNEAYISKIENGRHVPGEEMLKQLATALRINPATLRFDQP